MEDFKELRRREGPGRDPRDESLDELMSGYTPKQREALMSGLRILASVVVRAHTERRGPGSRTEPDRDGEDEGET